MKIDVICNTEDDILFENIARNSRLDIPWIEQRPAHEGHAVIVGGGPSLKDHLDGIRWRESLGQHIFALNNSYRFLLQNDIHSHYQVILDARRDNARFLEFLPPPQVGTLLASQCAPELFHIREDVTLWHPKIDGIETKLPDERESLTLIGGGTSVGLSALCLAYAMGYRKLHLFGYDSSHTEASHAYGQRMNAGEPTCKVTIFGKTFKTSWTMAKQAEFFPEICNHLIDLGCTVTIDGDGLLPFMVRESNVRRSITELEKYTAMWEQPEYREVSPGENCIDHFVEIANPLTGSSVIDFGCGTGRAGLALSEYRLKVTLLDFAPNCLDNDAKSLPFVQADLTEPIPITADYGYCTDVMEHIPPDKVDIVLHNILRATRRVFFQISLVPDNLGSLIGQQLHLSVHTFGWWLAKFKQLGLTVSFFDYDDLAAVFYVEDNNARL